MSFESSVLPYGGPQVSSGVNKQVRRQSRLMPLTDPQRWAKALKSDPRNGIYDNVEIIGKRYNPGGDMVLVARERDSQRELEIPAGSIGGSW